MKPLYNRKRKAFRVLPSSFRVSSITGYDLVPGNGFLGVTQLRYLQEDRYAQEVGKSRRKTIRICHDRSVKKRRESKRSRNHRAANYHQF